MSLRTVWYSVLLLAIFVAVDSVHAETVKDKTPLVVLQKTITIKHNNENRKPHKIDFNSSIESGRATNRKLVHGVKKNLKKIAPHSFDEKKPESKRQSRGYAIIP